MRQCRAWGAGFSEEEGKVTPRRAFQSSDIKLLISIATNNHPRKGQKDRQAQVSFVCVCVCVCIPYIYEGMREQGKRGEGRQHSGSVLSASSQSFSSHLLLPTDFSRAPRRLPQGPPSPSRPSLCSSPRGVLRVVYRAAAGLACRGHHSHRTQPSRYVMRESPI